jgi:hypothetical protein
VEKTNASARDLQAHPAPIRFVMGTGDELERALSPVDLARAPERFLQYLAFLAALLLDGQHHPIASATTCGDVTARGDAQLRGLDQTERMRRHQAFALGHGPELDAVPGDGAAQDHHAPIGEAPESLAVGDELLDHELAAAGGHHTTPTGASGARIVRGASIGAR